YGYMALAEKSLLTTIPEGKRGFEFDGEVCTAPAESNTPKDGGIALLVGSLRLHEKRDFKLFCLHSFFFVTKLLLIQCL
ncbi:hypothetical protein, partial [Bacteroides heparinolyticus]|uniref:hypothetical protein n=1 Tax=Prevotella heparinolytica TaxID=28113 RepID=UPI0035A11B15